MCLLLLAAVSLYGFVGVRMVTDIHAQSAEEAWAAVEITNISTSDATVTVSLSEGAEGSILHLHLRSASGGPWFGEDRLSIVEGQAQKKLTGLKAGTTYEIQVSLDGTFPPSDSLSRTFVTLPPLPFISDVKIEDVTRSRASIVVSIAYPGTESNTVYVRYRTDDSIPWSEPLIIQTNMPTVEVTLGCLSPGTGYKVEASLEEGFTAEQTVSVSFTTLHPRVSNVSIGSMTSSQATVTVSIEDSGQEANVVYLRYGVSTNAETVWTMIPEKSVIGDSTIFELTGLAPGTTYRVQASIDSEFNVGTADGVFATLPLPSLGAVNLASVAERTALIVLAIFDPDETEVTVFVRYRETRTRTWSAARNAASSTGRVEFELSGLEPGTEYEVEVSLEPEFGASLTRVFITEEEVTRLASLTLGKVTRSSVEIEVEIANAKVRNKVYVRYRSLGMPGWEPLRTISASSDTARLTLRNLDPDTLYEMEASLASDFMWLDSLYVTFTTDPGTELTEIRVENVTDTTADIIAALGRVEGRTGVNFRYQAYGDGEWSSPVTETTTSDVVKVVIMDLLPDTEYEIEASLDLSFPPSRTIYRTFETDPPPEISSLRISGITDSEAKASVTISRPQPRMTIYLRYRTEMDQAWGTVISKAASSRTASLLIEELMPETRYEIQVSLHADFEAAEGSFFTTEEIAPSVSGLELREITDEKATIDLTISGDPGSSNVYMRYREVGASRWIKPATRVAASSNISFELQDLAENTSYEIQASLDARFPVQGRVDGNFRTRSILRVSDVALEQVTGTDARISISLLGIYELEATTHIRYRDLPDGEWQGGRVQLERAESTVLLSDLMPDTEYLLQASIEEDFLETHTVSKKFRTGGQESAVSSTETPVAITADATPREFSFSVAEDRPIPGGSRLGIWSSDSASEMEVSIREDLQWLVVEPEAGISIKAGELLIVELKVDASGLGAGVYTGDIEILGNAENLPLRIPVTLTISSLIPTPEPTIRPSPSPTPMSFPQPTSTPQPTIFPVATPSSAAHESPAPSPSPIPNPGGQPRPTMAPVPTVPINILPVEETTSSLSPTPALSEVTERNKGLPPLSFILIVLASICILVVGISFIRRSATS